MEEKTWTVAWVFLKTFQNQATLGTKCYSIMEKRNSKYCLSFFFQNWVMLSAKNCLAMDEKTWNVVWVQNWTWIISLIISFWNWTTFVLRISRICVAWSGIKAQYSLYSLKPSLPNLLLFPLERPSRSSISNHGCFGGINYMVFNYFNLNGTFTDILRSRGLKTLF